MGVEERYKQKKKEEKTNGLYNGVENRYLYKNIESVSSQITSRLNTWLSNNKNYISNANVRFAKNDYRSDTSEWLNTVTTQRDNFTKEAENIKKLLNQYKDFFGNDYVNSVYEALDGNLKAQDSVINAANKDLEYWSQWESEDDYKTAKRLYGYYQKYSGKSYREISHILNKGTFDTEEEKEWLEANKYNILTTAADFAEGSKSGWQKYLADAEAEKNAPKHDLNNNGQDDWWETLLGYLGDVEDNTLPTTGVTQVANDLRADKSHLRPKDDWTQEQKDIFGMLYETASHFAYEFASETNKRNAKAKEDAQIQGIKDSATSDFWSGLGNTIGAIAAAPLAGADFLYDLAYVSAGRDIAPDGYISPFEYSQAVTEGISANLNEMGGTLDKNIPIIGGKGWGDVYGLGTSIAQSTASAYLLGPTGTLISYFGQGAAAGVDDALSRGATNEQALLYGAALGTFEGVAEKMGIDNLFKLESASTIKGLIKNILKQAGAEGMEEGATAIMSNIADAFIMQDKSNFAYQIAEYMNGGMSESDAKWRVFWDSIEGIAFDTISGAISGGVSGGLHSVAQTTIGNTIQGAEMKKTYGDDIGTHLTTEALEINPDNSFAQKMQNKIDSGKNLSGRQIGKLVQQNETAMYENDVKAIQSAVEERLTRLGEKGNVKALAEILTKQASGEKLTLIEKARIKSSTYGQRVANELNTDNIESGGYSSAWAEKIGTDRINAEAYSRMIQDMEAGGADLIRSTTKKVDAQKPTEVQNPSEIPQDTAVATQDKAGEAEVVTVTENTPAKENATEAEIKPAEDIPEAETSAESLEKASKAYGAQAGAMISTYNEGQDVTQYNAAYKVAYDMGKSGVSLDYAKNSEATSYLTESQRELAHAAGVDASSVKAKAQDTENRSKANGKTGRKKGVVRGEGVTIGDLKKTFNDKQNTAYKLLSTYAEATGIDIVLYKSEADANGNFIGGQGKFKWSEDTIYIDINAGLADINSVDKLAKYTMLRTFSHEFTHFIEKWNPIWYNEFRKVVFDTLTERGENVDVLITAKMEKTEGMDYDAASREVVAEAMTDILPDASFVEELATKHKNIFQKLLDMLKEFVADLKAYFNSLASNPSREANALKEQVGEGVKYLENIVKLFDKVALGAVENYQATVATEIETNNTYGGINNAGQKAENEGRTDTADAGSNARTFSEDGDGRGVSQEGGEVRQVAGQAVHLRGGQRELNQTKERFSEDSFITPRKGSVEAEECAKIAEYGIKGYVVKKSAWDRNVQAFSREGKIYIREGLDEKYRNIAAPHEATHVMKQLQFQPYLDFIERTPTMLDVSSEDARLLINKPAKHYNIDLSNADETQITRIYDEINATVYGSYVGGQIVGEIKEKINNAFYDFDAYIKELAAIHEQFKKENAPQKAKTEAIEEAAPQADNSTVEEREKAYKKKFSQWLKQAGRRYVIHYDGETFLSNGAFGMRATADEVGWARLEFSGTLEETSFPEQTKAMLDKANTLVTDAPLEGVTVDKKSVYVFKESGKQFVFDKKLLSKLDGNLFYMGDFMRGFKLLKAVDADGNVAGFLLPIKFSGEITDTKPSKLKSFSNKMQSIAKQEVKPNVENVDNQRPILESDADRQGDSRLLDEVQAEDVSGDAPRGDSVGDTRQRESQTGRPDMRSDTAARDSGGDGSGEVGDLRRDELTAEEAKEEVKKETEAIEREIEQKSTVEPKGRNFVIGDSLNLPSGDKARFHANVDAIRLIKQLESEGRFATEAEQEILSKYVGWGGLDKAFGEYRYNRDTRRSEMTAKDGWENEFSELRSLIDEGIITEQEYNDMSASTKNAHYTSVEVIKAMYDGLASLGFKGGRMLEPSSGVGNFVGAMPASMSDKVNSWTMVELDRVTGLIAKYLYPNADVRIQGFETANIPDNYMDVAIGNVPFGKFGVVDRAYPKRITKAIHNYFFAKSIDKVRPGGIVMFITSSFTMSSGDSAVRKYIMDRADLLGAIRLPNTAFKGNAGTEVVTDILVLKKRESGTEYAGEDFLEAEYNYQYTGHENIYFKNHPEMVLGKAVTARGMYGANTLTYEPYTDRGTIDNQIREAFKNIKGQMSYPEKLSREKTNFAVERANKKTKSGGFVVNPDGSISKHENGQLIKVDADEKTAKRIAGMLSIRDAYRKLASYLQQGLNESEIKAARKELNTAYDKFVKEFGYLNAPANKKAIDSDPDRYAIVSLEHYDAEKKTAKKADIFTKDTISANKTVTHVDSVEEGVIASINLTGRVDTELIAKLTDKTADEVTRDIIDSRLAFKTRDGGLVAREAYLSGNVRAKLREAESLAPYDADYNNNVEELRRVIPADIPYNEIYITPGATFIPNEVYADFIAHMLGGRNNQSYGNPDVEVGRSSTGEFKIVLNNKRLKTNYYNRQTWGTARKSFLELIDAMMGSRTVKVNDVLENADGKKITVVNEAETEAANEKVKAIQKEFEEWIWKDEDRRNALAKLYNETFNALVNPKYDGAHLSVNGINPMYTLMEHQANAVHRIIASGGNTLLAHRVGAGKTLEMASAAMKLRELGVIKKPVFVVPKSVVAQWGVEFKNYYPAARLLVADDKSFTPANRRIFTNMIANGDYDAVIVTYEQFEKIPMSAEYQRKFYEEQINEMIDAIAEEKAESRDGKGLTVKEMEKKKSQLEKKLKELTSKPKDEDNVDFEMLGIDSLFVDEAHNFKNLEYVSKMTNVAGLGSTTGAQRAFDLYTKIRYLQGLNGGRGIVFATATPVMNSMVELYIMQKYLQPDVLNQLGLKTFDAWAKQFGEVVNKWEINPSGTGMRQKQVFANFRNLNELQLLFRSFTDVVTDLPYLKIPKMKGGAVKIVECEPGEFQRNYMKELQKRAENVKNVDPSEDNMLKITSDGRKVSYTQRMIDPTLPYEPDSKIFKASDNILKEYKDSADIKGTQIVFLDMATPKGKDKSKTDTSEDTSTDTVYDEESAKLYDDMRNYLVKNGIPKREIAFIHEANSDAKRKQLFEDVNNGKVRVLIGSTGKMGVGMNAQKRVVAIHHLDAPWRPGDVEQRDGRAFRQKNINEEVSKYVYVTKGSFDSRLWDILDRKQHFINQIMNGEDVGRTAEDTGEVTLSAAEVKALASGNPLIEEQTKLTDQIKKLENLQKAYNSSMTLARTKLSDDITKIANYEGSIERIREDIAARKDTYSEGKFSINIGGKQFTDKKDAGVALAAEITAKASKDAYVTVAKFAGFELRVIKDGLEYKGIIHGSENYKFNVYMNNTTRMVNHIGEIIASFETMIANREQMIADTIADRDAQQNILSQPFEKQAELAAKRARFNEVMELLAPKSEEQLGKTAEDAVQEQSRSYLTDDYSTSGVHWGIKAGIISRADARIVWEAVANIDKKGYNSYQRTIDGEYFVEGNDVLMVVDVDYRNPVVKTIYKFKDNESYAKEILINARGIEQEVREAKSLIETVYGKGYVEQYDFSDRGTYERENGRGEGNHSGTDPEGEIQYQQRTNTLTDREILQFAADKLEAEDDALKASDKPKATIMTDAERDALQIFKNRLSNLENLQEQRAEQGRLYKEQQFKTPVDRKAAEATLNRMAVLDEQIKKAEADVLSLEDKKVFGDILKKAKAVVEGEQRKHDTEVFNRYVDRTKNAAAIKKYRERIKADVDELTSWATKPNNKDIVKHIPDALKNTVIPFLTSIDFTSKQQIRGGEATKADAEFIKRLNALNAALKHNIDVGGMYSGYNDLPPYFMDKLQNFINSVQEIVNKNSGEFVINKMTSEELKELSSVVRTIKSYIANFNKFHANAMFSHVWQAGDDTISALSAMRSDNGKANAASNFVFWQQIRPSYAFERFGKGGEAIYDGLRRGQAQLAFNTKKIVDFTEKAYTDKEVKAWEKEVKTIKITAGTVKMRVSDIMSFYLLAKQPDSLRHILGEGVRVATYTADGKKISDNGHTVTEGDIAIITSELTERQKQVADALQKFMAEQGGAWGNYVSVARFGEEQFTNEKYFPINSDGRHLQSMADENPSAASLYALLNMSFTKSRNELANNRIVIYSVFDVFANHMASMAQYNAMALPVLDAIKWFNYQQKTEDAHGNRYVKASVREQMDRVYGVPEETRPGSGKQGYAQSFVLNIIKAFNGTEAQGTPYDSSGLKALRSYNMAQIAYNFRVVVQQPLAITRAALLVDYRSIIQGMKLKPSDIKQNIAEMRKHSGIAAWKALGFYDVNISRGLTDTIKHNADWKQTVGEIGMKGAEWADTVAWAAIWSACKAEVIRKQKLKPSDAGFYEAVTKLFEDVIYKTQVVDSILTKNEYMRSKGFFARAMSSFMSEPATTASMLVDALDKYNADLKRGMNKSQAWEKNKTMIGRTIYVYAVSAVILAAVQAVADAFRDDDDYEEWYEKWLEAFGGNLIDEALPINKLPILSDFYDLAKELLSVFGVDTYGNPPQSVFMQWYDSLIKGTEIIYDKIAGEDTNYTWYGGIYKLLQAASGMSGLPMAAATREIITAWNNIVGAMAPSLKVKTYDPGEKNEIKYAYADGYLTFEEAVAELIKQGLVDNDDEAYFTVSGWEAGEGYSRYDKIYEAIRSGADIDEAMAELTSHGYTEKDVIKQIKSQIGKWYYDEESEYRISKQQAIDMLTKYTDMSSEDITKQVNKWSSKVVTGIEYDDIDDEFMAGNITAERAKEMYVRYGSMTREAATDKVTVLEFVKKHPSLEDISYSAVTAYTEYCEPQGIDAEIFYDVWQFNTNAKSDVDKNGNTISGSKKEKVLDYIHSLDLSRNQKDSLYYALGYSESTIREAPWR